MKHFGDTPPNGDFARYVEELTRTPALHAGMRSAPQAQGAAPAATPQAQPPRPSAGGVSSLWSTVRWAIVIWVALQLAARFVYAPLAALSAPLLVVLIAWVAQRFVRRRGLANLFSTPQWRDLMQSHDAGKAAAPPARKPPPIAPPRRK